VKLNKVVGAVSSSLETDDKLNLLSLATQLKGLRSGGIKSATIPLMPDPYATRDGQSVVLINYDALPDFLASVTGEPTAAQRVAAAKAADPASVTVDVLNGAGTAHGSSTALATFKSLGFKTGQPADAPSSQQTTTIYFPKGDESAAKAVSAALPGAAIAQSSDYKNVTVILGADGKMPAAPGTSTGSSSSSGSGSSGSSGASSSTSSGSSAGASPAATPSTKNYNKTTCIN